MVIVAIVLYAGLGIGVQRGMIKPRTEEKQRLQNTIKQHDGVIAQKSTFEADKAQAATATATALSQLEILRVLKMPPISFAAGPLYATEALLFEQGQDLGLIIVDLIDSTGNVPEKFGLPAVPFPAAGAAPPQVEPLAIPSSPVSISFQGNYQSFLAFLRRLPSAPRLLGVGNIIRMDVTYSPTGEKVLRVSLPIQEFTFPRGAEGQFSAPSAIAGVPVTAAAPPQQGGRGQISYAASKYGPAQGAGPSIPAAAPSPAGAQPSAQPSAASGLVLPHTED